MFKISLKIAVLIIVLFNISLSDSVWEWTKNNITLFSEVSYDGDFRLFAFHKNKQFVERYMCEHNMNVDLTFIGVEERIFWMFRAELGVGCGDSETGMVFHPYDVSYALIPTLEYRFKKFHVSAGLDHRCFHYIDQRPPEPIVYWNKLIFSINSAHRRVHPFYGDLLEDATWQGLNRLMWNFTWGYYLTEFFGLLNTIKLMSVKRPHYLHDFRLTAEYGLVRWKWGAVALTGATLLGFKNKGSTYWAQETGAELLFALGNFDTALFVNYIFDKGRFDFDSKDRLLEFGFRVIK